jgi:hypothetical protein
VIQRRVKETSGSADVPGVTIDSRPLRDREPGFVMVVTAIVFPILIMSVAFVVDVSMFFFKSVQVQRAADAAALAGVTRMPRTADAVKLAKDIAKRNGYQNNVDNVSVVIAPPADTNKRLKVTIVDNSTPLFFGTTLLKNWKIQKTSTAEYVSNIPLGSKENAIGTGDVTDTGTGQGFWLAISGPCAAKEAGDQIASRYDGTTVQSASALFPNTDPDRNLARICDYNKSEASASNDPTLAPFPLESVLRNKPLGTDTGETYRDRLRGYLKKARLDRGTALFPAVSLNRDWDPEGYNYIVDTPCVNTVDRTSPPPPPCDGSGQGFSEDTSTIGKDLFIQVYDPVFNPKPIDEWLTPTEQTNAAHPDMYGLSKDLPPPLPVCGPATEAGCTIDTGTRNPRPDTVRVTTQFSVYKPDLTPLDYSDDGPSLLTSHEYGSCVAKFASSPIVYAGRVDTLDDNGGPDCATSAGRWVTIAQIPNASGARGRYRVNVRTLTAVDSYGSNSFAIRSFFAPSAAPAWQPCSAVDILACASVSGDSTMSVFASAPSIKEFYLAKLAPAAIYRGKTVMLRLWDIGEGGSSLQVLRPRSPTETCDNRFPDPPVGAGGTWTDPDPAFSTNYCTQMIRWSIGPTGINRYSNFATALEDTGQPLGDVCDGKGQDAVFSLPIAGNHTDVETCTATVPTETLNSRVGPYTSDFGKFNDRLVNVKIEVPPSYGCDPIIWASARTCTEIALPQQGWWKIKYIPRSVAGVYQPITDRSTWTVELLGEPVHLVLDN